MVPRGCYGSHNNSFTSEALIVIGDVHLSLFALTSLQTVGNKKNCFLPKMLSTKPSLFLKSDCYSEGKKQVKCCAGWQEREFISVTSLICISPVFYFNMTIIC